MPGVLRGELDALPEAWAFYRLAAQGDADNALHRLPKGSDDPVVAYNRFVLAPSPTGYAELCQRLHGDLGHLLEVVAYRDGLREQFPEPVQTEHAVVAAYTRATLAHARIDAGDLGGALAELEGAAESIEAEHRVFAARLWGEAAALEQVHTGPSHRGTRLFQRAIDLLEETAFASTQAEFWLQLGVAHTTLAEGRKGALQRAVQCFHQALKTFTREDYPESFALAQVQVALAYLAMPMQADAARLRPAIAVQCLREALSIFTPQDYPDYWASTTMNLANALQHLPSAHRERNLWEAIQLYDQVLEVRKEAADPLGYARVLANQGNALAHLGAFRNAVPRLEQARKQFSAHGDHDAAEAVGELLAEIATRSREAEVTVDESP